MNETITVQHNWDVDARLISLGFEREDLVRVALQAAMARNESVSIDPSNAPGQLAYIYGVRGIRECLLPKGWKIDRTDNIEGTVNTATGIKILYQNVDFACAKKEPRAISAKGVAAARMVENATYFLFSEMEEEHKLRSTAGVWFLCVSVNGEEVRAELSRPLSIELNQFNGFAERILVLNDGLLDGIEKTDYDTDQVQNDYDVNVTRKS